MATLQEDYNRCLYHVSSALHRWLDRLAEKHFSKVGLSPMEGFLLMTVKEAPGVMITHLARVHQVVPSHITRIVTRSRSNGLMHVDRYGRTKTVFLTKRGMKKEADARVAWNKLQLEYEEIMGRNEVKYLAERLSKSVKELEAYRS